MVCSLQVNTIEAARVIHLSKVCCTTMGSYDVNISACTLCTTTEFDWGPTGNSDSAGYICSKCLDLQRHVRHRDTIHRIHRQLHKALPQLCVSYIYDFVFQQATANGEGSTGTSICSVHGHCNCSWEARRGPTIVFTTYTNNCSKH